MRIGIDARFFGSIGKGLGRYTQKLIENLELIDDQNEYFVFLIQENFEKYQPRNKNFHKIIANYKWYSFAEQFLFPKLLKKYNLDLMHFLHFNVPLMYREKFIVTIHDLILMHFSTIKASTLNPFFYRIKFAAYKIVIASAIKRAKKIITVSCFTKNDILKNFSINCKKVVVTYEGSSDTQLFLPKNDKNILNKYGIIKPYLLYVGNAYPHKNLEKLILSFYEVRKIYPFLRLVLVGKEDYFYQRLKKVVIKNKIPNVIFTGFVPDEDLDVIYYNALVYVFPSLYEGFGLPPLEAMSKGVPVVSSDHSCMREILEESAFYVNAREKNDLSRGILKVVENKEFRKKLIQSGYKQIKKYSWKKMAEETLKIYKEIYKENILVK